MHSLKQRGVQTYQYVISSQTLLWISNFREFLKGLIGIDDRNFMSIISLINKLMQRFLQISSSKQNMGNDQFGPRKQAILEKRRKLLEVHFSQIRSIIQQQKLTPLLTFVSNLTVTEAVRYLNNNTITSQGLVAILAYNTATVGVQLNLFTFTNFQEALQMARSCDSYRKKTGMKNWTFSDEGKKGQFLPPLFGIPISVKDVFDMKGFPTTIGLVVNDKQKQKNSPLIQCFKKSGMIPFIRSNVPQYCMSAETNNNIFGRSLNPWNKQRSVGGSSGGEAGLISARCSLLGVGSDIGGSIRVPSEHCGIFGLKPSSKRISNQFHAQISKVVSAISNVIPLTIGPLAKSTNDLALFMKV